MNDSHLITANVCNGIPGQGQVYHCSDLSDEERERCYGRAELEIPSSIVAGETVEVTFRFILGETALGEGAGLRVAWRWPFDWSDPQTDDPDRPNHATLARPDGVSIDLRYQLRGDLDPWHHDLDLRVREGSLEPGDIVEIHVADWEASTFATPDGAFLFVINPDGHDQWIRLVDPPRFTVAPGSPEQLLAISPGDGIVGEQAIVRVRAVDAWENATPIDAPILLGEGVDIATPALCSRYPVWGFPVTWSTAGVHRLSASSGNLCTSSNPTLVHEDPPETRLYWGDVHAGQSEIGCGAGSLDHHYAYARDVASLQFASQQANDHYVSREIWQHVRDVTPRHDAAGEFLAYLGCEWSPPTVDGGDRNVLYLSDEPRMRRSGRFFTEREPDPEPDLPYAPEFLYAFRDEEVFLNLHVGGRPTNLEWHAPKIEPLFEIHSTHATSEWFVFDAIEKGYKVGITAGTDGVMGRPGACGPGRRVTRNVRNGLTAVRATGLQQRSVAEAFLARRCYGTTGARILLDVDVDGHPMGSAIEIAGPPTLNLRVDGTAPIERVDLLRDTEVIHTWDVAPPEPGRYRLLWGGAKTRGTAGDQRQIWDGSMSIEPGRLFDVRTVGFQGAVDQLAHAGDRVDWISATAGTDAGFTFASSRQGSIDVETEVGTCSVNLEQVQSNSHRVDCGGLDRYIEIGLAPSDASPLGVELQYMDESPLPGEHAYWVRVVQIDRQRAWSSPVYVTAG